MLGLVLSLSGLVLVVFQSLILSRLSTAGVLFALGALACSTIGAMLQKRVKQAPSRVLPLQFAVTLVLCACFIPVEPIRYDFHGFALIPILYLGLIISVGAQLLLYRLIRTGNLVNVTSLFYLVPVVTVILDYLIFRNALQPLAMTGMAAILAGLLVVFRMRSVD